MPSPNALCRWWIDSTSVSLVIFLVDSIVDAFALHLLHSLPSFSHCRFFSCCWHPLFGGQVCKDVVCFCYMMSRLIEVFYNQLWLSPASVVSDNRGPRKELCKLQLSTAANRAIVIYSWCLLDQAALPWNRLVFFKVVVLFGKFCLLGFSHNLDFSISLLRCSWLGNLQLLTNLKTNEQTLVVVNPTAPVRRVESPLVIFKPTGQYRVQRRQWHEFVIASSLTSDYPWLL